MPDQPADGTAGPQWTDEVANRIESVVGSVRDKTTVPATKVARGVVFGLVAAVLGVVALVLLIIALVRLHVYLPFHPESRRLWVTYAGLGAIFVIVGAFLWRKRQPRVR
ncbi:MAG: hypothetical protein J2P57_07045 [Acidimicrobiaceae bacterium]|nr:hypothetical protein [Acidimicrobiaceae bacterium]